MPPVMPFEGVPANLVRGLLTARGAIRNLGTKSHPVPLGSMAGEHLNDRKSKLPLQLHTAPSPKHWRGTTEAKFSRLKAQISSSKYLALTLAQGVLITARACADEAPNGRTARTTGPLKVRV